MLTALFALALGLVLLVWSAGRFVEGSAAAARQLGIRHLLIGMVVIGFGTSAPELIVSAMAAVQGNPGLALGNGYGSNICNIGLILGLTALLSPIAVHSTVLRRELPILTVISLLAVAQIRDGDLSRLDALLLLLAFAGLMGWSIRQGLREGSDALAKDTSAELAATPELPLRRALGRIAFSLALLVGASRLLVWGAVTIAHSFGVSDLVIGLTIVAVGTSLPELASSLVAIRRNEHDLALGNVLGSNLFNTLAVVGLAGTIHPLPVEPTVLLRDMPVMLGMTVSLFLFGYGFRGQGRINRVEGGLLLGSYIAYTLVLLDSVRG